MTESARELTEKERLLRDLARFRLAEADMRQVIAAADFLVESGHPGGDLRRALETAVVVCYWRPFDSRNKIGTLGKRWTPKEPRFRLIHNRLRELRHEVYAHTDLPQATGARGVVSVAELGFDGNGYTEWWQAIDPDALSEVIGLAKDIRGKLLAAAAIYEEQLAAL
jgi:hypothetical protein